MPGETERLDILVNVVDEFSTELRDLANSLYEVAGTQRLVDEDMVIDVDVRGEQELSELNREMAMLQSQEFLQSATPGGGASAGRAMASGGFDDGRGATADGGGPSFLDAMDIDHVAREMGDAFSEDALIEWEGQPTAPMQMLGPSPHEVLDSRAITRGLLDDDSNIDRSVISRLFDTDVDAFSEALDVLRSEDAVDLPRNRSFMHSIRDFDLTASQLHNLYASFIPLLAVLIGALPAAITGIVALGTAALGAAGALGAIAGLGALGVALQEQGPATENFADMMEEVQDEFIDALGPLARQLAPLFRDGLDGLERFFNALASRGAVLLELRQEARAFGGFLLDTLPTAIALLGRFADAASPAFAAFGNFLEDAGLAGRLAGALALVLPELAKIGSVIWQMLPVIFDLSHGFLMVFSAIVNVIGVFLTIIDILPISTKFVGALIASLFVLATVTVWYTKITKALRYELYRNFITTIYSTIKALYAKAGAMVTTTAATWGMYAAVSALLGLLTFGAAPLLSWIGGLFGGVGGNIKDATTNLDNFASGTQDGSFGPNTAAGSTAGQSAYDTLVVDNSSTTIEAPDRETGTAVSSYNSYQSGTAADRDFSS